MLNSALLTDFYQLTMLQAYRDQGMDATAVFEFFVREMPPGRNFLLAAGLEQVLDYLENLSFAPDECAWLKRSGYFKADFVDALAALRFTGQVDAMAEGTPFFANEPVLRVIAPLAEAQLIETRLINLLQFEILVASKAARCVLAAPGKLLVDFGMRRAHGAEAALLSARASYLAGFAGSSNVLAGQRWDIPLFGTMAHAFIQTHDDELKAFEHFACSFPQTATWLIDTYDTERAAERLLPLVSRLRHQGIAVQGVRLDSGDLDRHARRVRAILDRGGETGLKIFVSGDLDEYRLRQLQDSAAPIDGFGIGTRMSTSSDHPFLDCAYKLQEYAGQARRKRSEGKMTWPGRKQVIRSINPEGEFFGDLITTVDDVQAGEMLLHPVMRDGRRLAAALPLVVIRQRTARQLAALPAPLHQLDRVPAYPVRISDPLRQLACLVDWQLLRP